MQWNSSIHSVIESSGSVWWPRGAASARTAGARCAASAAASAPGAGAWAWRRGSHLERRPGGPRRAGRPAKPPPPARLPRSWRSLDPPAKPWNLGATLGSQPVEPGNVSTSRKAMEPLGSLGWWKPWLTEPLVEPCDCAHELYLQKPTKSGNPSC